MNKDTVTGLVEDFYAARMKNDTGMCLSCFADGARFVLAGANGATNVSAETGECQPLDPIIDYLVANWRWEEIQDRIIICEWPHVAVRYMLIATHVPSGDRVSTQIMDHLEFDDAGKVTAFTEFLDTALIASYQ